MSTAATPVSKEKSKIFETILSSPGMNEKCKLVMQVSRQNILLLARLIESGLLVKNQGFDDEIIAVLPMESQAAFKELHAEILSKGGLTEFYEKLKSL
jgi:hypothetical protein